MKEIGPIPRKLRFFRPGHPRPLVSKFCQSKITASQLFPRITWKMPPKIGKHKRHFPTVNSNFSFGNVMGLAIEKFGKYFNKNLSELCLVFICHERRNFAGHKKIENAIRKRFDYNILSHKMTLEELANCEITNGAFFVKGREVALFHFRSGYDPGMYENENSWKTRRLIELSRAIKSPS